MFPLSDQARRGLCVVLFLLLGAVPTIAVGLWCLGRHRPERAAAEADRLGAQLGLRVTLGAVEHSRPGVVRYRNVQLLDPETGRLVARCDTIDASWQQTSGRFPALRLEPVGLELALEQREELLRLYAQVTQSRTVLAEPCLRIAAAKATMTFGPDRQVLEDVQVAMDTLPQGVQTEIIFRLAELGMVEPARLRLGRNRQTTPPADGFEFSTGSAALPCRWLGALLPMLHRLGPESRVVGSLSAHQGSDGWQGEFRGQVVQIDLKALLDPYSPNQLVGVAQATIHQATFRRNRLEEARGVLFSGPGWIGRSLVGSAVQRLNLALLAELASPGEFIRFEQLGVAFALDRNGVRLQGQCAGPATGVILADQNQALLGNRSEQPLPPGALVQWLCAQGELQVPASGPSARLLALLPLPEAATAVPQTASGGVPGVEQRRQ